MGSRSCLLRFSASPWSEGVLKRTCSYNLVLQYFSGSRRSFFMSIQNTPADVWASGNSYEPFVGRWSRLVAQQFLRWLAVPEGKRWLDVGCGTGALSQTILDLSRPGQLKGIDRSEGFVQYARSK